MINPFLQSLFRRNKFLASCCSSFFRSSKFSALSRREAPSKLLQGFTLCFQLLFLSIILLLLEFSMESLHGGSSRIPFILQLFFKISLEVMIRQDILQNKHGAQHMFYFEEFKHSSSCIPKCNSFDLIFWGGVRSFLIISLRVSWFTSFQEWHIQIHHFLFAQGIFSTNQPLHGSYLGLYFT